MNRIALSLVLAGLAVGALEAGCGGNDTSNSGGSGQGGSGGTPSSMSGGGQTTQNTGGSNTGGQTTLSSGGSNTGGSNTGGSGGANTGGSGGANTGGSGGAATGGGGSGGAAAATLIQDIQDGTVAAGDMASISGVYVTSNHTSAAGTVTLTVQEPQGTTKAGITYPARSGIEVVVGAASVVNFPDLATLKVDDCVKVTGKVQEFHMATEISTPTVLSKVVCSGAAPTPFVVENAAFASIATDAGGAVAGAKAEDYEFVLLQVKNVDVSGAASSSGFNVVPHGQSALTPILAINNFLSGPIVSLGTQYTSITGIYEQFDTYALYPRATTDLVP